MNDKDQDLHSQGVTDKQQTYSGGDPSPGKGNEEYNFEERTASGKWTGEGGNGGNSGNVDSPAEKTDPNLTDTRPTSREILE